MLNYFKEILITLKRIESHLNELRKCVKDAPCHGSGKVVKISHWND